MVTVDEYIEAFQLLLPDLHERKVAALKLLADHHATGITARQIAASVGGEGYSAANNWIGQLGKSLYLHLKRFPEDVDPKYKKGYFRMLATGRKAANKEFHWLLRPEVLEALQTVGFVKALNADYWLPEEIDAEQSLYVEGTACTVTVNAYERDPAARLECIALYGYQCVCCGVDLQQRYGLAKPHIHVHHLRPLAKRGGKYSVNPAKDLRPVCPNCHAVIHRSDPILTIEQVRKALESAEAKCI